MLRQKNHRVHKWDYTCFIYINMNPLLATKSLFVLHTSQLFRSKSLSCFEISLSWIHFLSTKTRNVALKYKDKQQIVGAQSWPDMACLSVATVCFVMEIASLFHTLCCFLSQRVQDVLQRCARIELCLYCRLDFKCVYRLGVWSFFV